MVPFRRATRFRSCPVPAISSATRKNVQDSDALIVTFGPARAGTARTIEFCQKLGKPPLIIDATGKEYS